ncbi:MAG TPA: transcription initiation factor IIB [Candidatus Nitrosocosmicus sp.]
MSQKVINSSSSSLCQLCKMPTNIIVDGTSGEVICTNCGSVLNELEDIKAEWGVFDAEDRNSKLRTGGPTSLAIHDRGLSTRIGNLNRDASGQPIESSMVARINRWKKWDFRSQNNNLQRNLHNAFYHLDLIKNTLSLSDSAIEKVAYLYRKIQEKGLVKGRTIRGVIVVSTYITCRELEIPRTLKEISAILNVSEKSTSKIYRKVVIDLDLKIPQPDLVKISMRISNKCGISEKAKRYAIRLVTDLKKNDISVGKHPMGLAGAVVYAANKMFKENVTQGQVAAAAGITEVTLRHNLNSVMKMNLI